jgi:threonine synthase
VRFVSTAGKCPPADLATALLQGLAPDGGLYLPECLPAYPGGFFRRPATTMADAGLALLGPFLDEVPADVARRLVADALDFDVPLVELEDGVHVLELFHGPTLAFKDVAARFLARFLAWLARGSERPLTVLVATSGDTGSAVAQAFLGVAGTRVAVLYPRGKVSPLQEKQFTTLGGNVEALAVDGVFDDCQRLVKAAFVDRELQERLFLTSANSINVGRLLPQMVYYVHAVAQLGAGAPSPLISVPSGNFGNLTAGLLAKRLGMPAARFVAATNVNDVVPEYLESGVYAPRPSRATISNAMDVGDPSNFARLLALYGGDAAALRRDLRGSRHDDDATRRAIREVYARTGYVLDPHTAVGYLGLKESQAGAGADRPGIVLATAHPVKFREHVEPLIGRAIEVPERLARCLERESRARPLAAELSELKAFLLDWGP